MSGESSESREHPSAGTALDFEGVLASELETIEELRVRRGVRARESRTDARTDPKAASRPPLARAHSRRLVGLAFSGGGIRSATFNLGVLQTLARLGLLRHFDYLSTVSGGGYIGSWLTAWIKRHGIDAVERGLTSEHPQNPKRSGEKAAGTGAGERPPGFPITFLRQYSSYLTPQRGLLSLDTWMTLATVLRNLILNQTLLVLFLAGVLLVPRLFASGVLELAGRADGSLQPAVLVALMAIFGVVAAFAVAVKMEIKLTERFRWLAGPTGVFCSAVLTIFALAVCFSFWLYSQPRSVDAEKWMLRGGLAFAGFWLLVAIVWWVYWLASERRDDADYKGWRDFWPWLWSIVAAFLAGAAVAWGFWLFARFKTSVELEPVGWLRVTIWAPPGVVLLFILTAVYYVGLLGRQFPEEERQWMSRLGGWLGLTALGWLLLFGASFYAPALLLWLGQVLPKLTASVGLAWVASTVSGILAGRSSATGSKDSGRLAELVAGVAPYVFIVGLIALLALGAHMTYGVVLETLDEGCMEQGLPSWACRALGSEGVAAGGEESLTAWRLGPQGAPSEDLSWGESYARVRDRTLEATAADLQGRPLLLVVLVALLVGTAALLSWRIDINEFSLHNFYRDRLSRSYLGASRERNPNPFTGFDRDDDLRLDRLLEAGNETAAASGWRGEFDGPYPILNTALNLTSGGSELAWQERQANSFVFTPRYYGFEPGRTERARGITAAYRPTAATGVRGRRPPAGVTLGTALAVSGAAVSPHMGYHSAPALSFLLTVFNARLGRWMGNPANDKTWKRTSPTFGLMALLDELAGASDSHSDWVSLSDGGFFDNLGIYELVRRRCRFILSCDAEADPDLGFEGLGNAIRRCRSDFGIEIRFENLDPIRQDPESGLSRWHCAVGTIHYDMVDEDAPRGILVYLKASLTGDEPADIRHYQRTHPEFPHESTADQWFDESQFESYRRLGEHAADVLFSAVDLHAG